MFSKIPYNKSVDKDFVQILKEFLKENKMSQSEFARAAGVKPYNVSDWLKGKAKPGYDALKAMAKSLDISADYFLGLTDEY